MKHQQLHDYYNCYICPNNKILPYATTNRKEYIEYKSNPKDCKNRPFLSKCTNSKNHTKVITRHILAEAFEIFEEIRHQSWFNELKKREKKTAKEFHGLCYTNQIGIEKMHMKMGLTFTCLNMKKLAKRKRIRAQRGVFSQENSLIYRLFIEYYIEKRQTSFLYKVRLRLSIEKKRKK